MVRNAKTIDLVVADRLTADFEVGTRAWSRMRTSPNGSDGADAWLRDTRDAWAEDGARIHFRVVRRLKGASPAEFSFNGSKAFPFEGRRPLAPRPVLLSQLHYFLNPADLLDGPQMGDCTIAVVGEVGRMYLIFRDADGFPLRTEVPVRFRGRTGPSIGPSVVPVVSMDDPWPRLILQALAKHP